MSFIQPNYLNLISQTPLEIPVYSGAPDWVSITGAVTNEVLFLTSDATNGKYTIRTIFTRPASENIYIDWGDGSPLDTISTTTATDTTHTYTSGGTACSRGYNTWKVRVYGDTGTRITTCKIITNATDYSEYPSGLIQAWYGDNTVTTMKAYFHEADGTLPSPVLTYLEFVRVPNGLSGDALYETFFNCRSLQKVELPSSLSGLTGAALQSTFYNCSALIDCGTFPTDMTGNTSLSQTFYQCYALPQVIIPGPLPSVTTASRILQNCNSVGYVYLPPLPSCTNYGLSFANCYNLRSMSIPIIPNTTVDLLQMFLNCVKLQTVFFDPNTTATFTSTNSMFNGCNSLKEFRFPLNSSVESCNLMFNACYSLTRVIMPTDGTRITTFASMFNACNMLEEFTFPSTPPSATTISCASMFATCRNLTEITIPNSYGSVITSLDATFSNSGVNNVVLPTTMNALTTLANGFLNCIALRSVSLPTSMNACTTMATCFGGCFSLLSVTFPTTMASLNTIQSCFNNCNALQSVTLPTSINGNLASGLGGIFSNCWSIKSITMPATIVANTTPNSYGSCFNNCYSLQSLTLPTSNLTSISNCTSMINGCRSLTGITNSSTIGNSSTTGAILNPNTTFGTDARSLLSLTLIPRIAKLELNGTAGSATNLSQLNSLRLTNTGTGQWGGTSPQIDISYTSLSTAALNTLFADIAAQGNVTSKTINITGAVGAAGLSAADRLVITSKGWTITG